jgi:hypothetical protein
MADWAQAVKWCRDTASRDRWRLAVFRNRRNDHSDVLTQWLAHGELFTMDPVKEKMPAHLRTFRDRFAWVWTFREPELVEVTAEVAMATRMDFKRCQDLLLGWRAAGLLYPDGTTHRGMSNRLVRTQEKVDEGLGLKAAPPA